jgi:hypothetical protein
MANAENGIESLMVEEKELAAIAPLVLHSLAKS